MSHVAAVDIGGTKISVAAVSSDGTLGTSRTVRTPTAEGPAAILDTVSALVRGLGEVGAVGVGSAGVVDPRTGAVHSATAAIPGWAGTRLREELTRRLGIPAVVVNDVHAHALGEYRQGAAHRRTPALFVAAGTGVGGSIVLDGRVLHGAHGAAGHVGHVPVAAAAGRPCACGGSGHVEAVSSGPAMTEEYARRSGRAVAGLEDVVAASGRGDSVAGAVIVAGAAALGSAIGGLANVVDPEIVVVGGGATRCGTAWWDALHAATQAELLPVLAGLDVVPARLGADAALVGAGQLAWGVLG